LSLGVRPKLNHKSVFQPDYAFLPRLRVLTSRNEPSRP
jgi:hypothetical protein